MRSKLYTHTRPHIICMRVNDDEMESMKELMEKTNLKASEMIRHGFNILATRFAEERSDEQGGEYAVASHG